MKLTLAERDRQLRNLLDQEFLNKLAEVGRLHGWSSDYIEIEGFVEQLFEEAGIKPPNLEPYEIDYDVPNTRT